MSTYTNRKKKTRDHGLRRFQYATNMIQKKRIQKKKPAIALFLLKQNLKGALITE
jgi:hypothetical protein